ncbi:hypothetical protein B7463_g4982, partial [Scytalidium lignicola]
MNKFQEDSARRGLENMPQNMPAWNSASKLSASFTPQALSTSPPQFGNADAAQDLYGLGVRIGFYLQALGMILYNYGNKKDYGKGLKVASGSITISILASWFVFASRKLFSPSEAIIVLLVLMSLSFPAKTTLLNPRTIVGETVGLITLLVAELGTCSALIWTFAQLVDTLPSLNTDNVVFFFAKVAIHGWFRYLALVYCIFDGITSLSFAYRIARVTAISWDCYKNGNTDADESEIERIKDITRQWQDIHIGIHCLRWLTWVLIIVTVELTVRWNHLSPTTDLQAPGQLIPLVTGIIILIDSSLVAGYQVIPRYVRPILTVVVNGAIGSVVRLFLMGWPVMRRKVLKTIAPTGEIDVNMDDN